MGKFRIWRKVEVDERYSEVFILGFLYSVIFGFERVVVFIVGIFVCSLV